MNKCVKAALSLLLFAGFSLTVSAERVTEPREGIISGRVIDNTKQALPGAYVSIEGLKTGDISDVNGFYSIKNLKPGKYKVKVSYYIVFFFIKLYQGVFL